MGPDALLKVESQLTERETSIRSLSEILFLASHGSVKNFEKKILTTLIKENLSQGGAFYPLEPTQRSASRKLQSSYGSAPKKIRLDWDLLGGLPHDFEKVLLLETEHPFTQALFSQGLRGTLFIGLVDGKPSALWALSERGRSTSDFTDALLGLWNFNASKKNREAHLRHLDHEHLESQKTFQSLLNQVSPWIEWNPERKTSLCKELGIKALNFLERKPSLTTCASFGFPSKPPRVFKTLPSTLQNSAKEQETFLVWLKQKTSLKTEMSSLFFLELGKKMSLFLVFKNEKANLHFQQAIKKNNFLIEFLESAFLPKKPVVKKKKIVKTVVPSPSSTILKTILANKIDPGTTPNS
jgi:hypothetical protein